MRQIAINSSNIVLTPIYEDDRSYLERILSDPCVGKTYMLPERISREELRKLCSRFILLSRDPQRYVRAIRCGEIMVGFINDTGSENGSIELGWVISPEFQNRGICSVAVGIAIRELFSLGYSCIFAGYFRENTPSLRVMEKNGLRPMEKEEVITYRGEERVCVYRMIRREDWLE